GMPHLENNASTAASGCLGVGLPQAARTNAMITARFRIPPSGWRYDCARATRESTTKALVTQVFHDNKRVQTPNSLATIAWGGNQCCKREHRPGVRSQHASSRLVCPCRNCLREPRKAVG